MITAIPTTTKVGQGTLLSFVNARCYAGEDQRAAFLKEFNAILVQITDDWRIRRRLRMTLPKIKSYTDAGVDHYIEELKHWALKLTELENLIIMSAPVIWPEL